MGSMGDVRVERRGDVAVVTLDRPPANAMTSSSLNGLADLIDELGTDDDDLRGIVLTGAGRSFSAGLDLKALQGSGDAAQEDLIEALNRAFLTAYACPRLMVAAVNGHAIAGGLVLALCCDVRLVADVALAAGLAEVRVSVVFPLGALEVVRNELPPSVLRRLVLDGRPIGAADSVDLGVFDRLVAADALLDEAVAAAADGPPPDGFAKIKEQLRRPALERMRAVIGGGDPLTRPWLTAETFAAAAAALSR